MQRKVNVVEDLDGNKIVVIHDIRFKEVGRYNVFRIIMVVRHAEDGKMYLYDIMNIKKETSTHFQSRDLTQSKTHFLSL